MRKVLIVALAVQLVLPPALAWDTPTHRIITYLALDGLSADVPAWLRTEAARHQVAYQASEADRWKGTRSAPLNHNNRSDHFLDVELLDQFGLTLETVPPLRYEYLRALAVAKYVHPERVEPYDASADPYRYKEWPGFLPHAITERFAKLRSSFHTLRMLEKLDDPKRVHQLNMAKANVMAQMGALSHFVGDSAQPLHTTRHFNGWSGENPNGYTTSKRFHAYVDGGLTKAHGLTVSNLRPHVKFDVKFDKNDPWKDTLNYIRASFALVEPLYRMERDGQLTEPAGKQFVTERVTAAAAMLAAMYSAAYADAKPTDEEIKMFEHYDAFGAELETTSPVNAERDSAAP